MPPLTQKSRLEKSGYVYEVSIKERDADAYKGGARTKDTFFTEGLSGAFEAAMTAFDSDPQFSRTSETMMHLYEPHGEGEKHTAATLRKRKVHCERL